MSTTADATIRNGVDTTLLFATLDAIKADPSLATFQFRARNRWIDGAHNRTTIRDFYAANQEDTSRAERVRGRRGRAGDPARHRHRAEPGRVPAPRTGRLSHDLARLRRRGARRRS